MATIEEELAQLRNELAGHRQRMELALWFLHGSGPIPNADAPGQPPPTGAGTPILPLVIADLQRRGEQGKKKYGTVLRANNGRDALRDLYEELQDATLYARQELEQRAEVAAKARAAALEEVVEVLEDLLGPGAGSDPAAYAFAAALRRAICAVRDLAQQPPKGAA